jgi:hypothetical protein
MLQQLDRGPDRYVVLSVCRQVASERPSGMQPLGVIDRKSGQIWGEGTGARRPGRERASFLCRSVALETLGRDEFNSGDCRIESPPWDPKLATLSPKRGERRTVLIFVLRSGCGPLPTVREAYCRPDLTQSKVTGCGKARRSHSAGFKLSQTKDPQDTARELVVGQAERCSVAGRLRWRSTGELPSTSEWLACRVQRRGEEAD